MCIYEYIYIYETDKINDNDREKTDILQGHIKLSWILKGVI